MPNFHVRLCISEVNGRQCDKLDRKFRDNLDIPCFQALAQMPSKIARASSGLLVTIIFKTRELYVLNWGIN